MRRVLALLHRCPFACTRARARRGMWMGARCAGLPFLRLQAFRCASSMMRRNLDRASTYGEFRAALENPFLVMAGGYFPLSLPTPRQRGLGRVGKSRAALLRATRGGSCIRGEGERKQTVTLQNEVEANPDGRT